VTHAIGHRSHSTVLLLERLSVALLVLAAFFAYGVRPCFAQQKPPAASAPPPSAPLSDPLLQVMHEELGRSKAHLKMDNVAAPYYIEYRLTDFEIYTAEASFGAVLEEERSHVRLLRVVVRVGDYKLDSYYGPGTGAVDFATLDDNPMALRRRLWLATDQAYKAASLALASKQALLSQYSSDEPIGDFAPEPPLRVIGLLAKLDFPPDQWRQAIEKATKLYRIDPKIESLSAKLIFRAVNDYFVNTEGTATREGFSVYSLQLSASTQADDGMTLARSPSFAGPSISDLPSEEKLLVDTSKMLQSLKDLRDAPMVEEDYRGPILFSNDAASDIFASLIGANVLGVRPKPGESGRTTGEFSSNYKGRVLPTFLTVVDDPTMKTFEGKGLVGSFEFDTEGVRAAPVTVIQDGILVNYLLGRTPIRDFPESNGHGRGASGQAPSPSIGNLILRPKESTSPSELKKKLIEMCKDRGLPYGYYIETLYELNPRLLYRVYVGDGHEELVRGAVFNELDTRALRGDLVAAGNDPLVSNRDAAVPTTVIAPSLLFDELEVKRTDKKNDKLPEYPPPDLSSP
jgi:TldD protein